MSNKRLSTYFPILFFSLDILFLNVSIGLANLDRFNQFLYTQGNYDLLLIIINVVWTVTFFYSRLHKLERNDSIQETVNRVVLAITASLAVIFAIWVLGRTYYFSREHLFFTYILFSTLIIAWRVVFILLIRYYRTKGFNIRNVVLVGSNDVSNALKEYMIVNPGFGYVVKGLFTQDQHDDKTGDVNDVFNYCQQNTVDIIFCCTTELTSNKVREIVNYAENNLIKIHLISSFSRFSAKSVAINKIGDIPIINITSIPLDSKINQYVKRAFDIIFSTIVMITILSWLIPLIGILIKLESNGGIFFMQNRHGKDNQLFLCYKFRTMVVNNLSDSKQATKNDPRITKVGAVLRKTSIDEIPQFINVFLGDMSVVGPRPHPIKLNEEFAGRIDRFFQRHAVKPGITGLAQAKGFRGETSKFNDMYGRVKLDRFYVKNWSLFLDLKIILLTIISIIKNNENAY